MLSQLSYAPECLDIILYVLDKIKGGNKNFLLNEIKSRPIILEKREQRKVNREENKRKRQLPDESSRFFVFCGRFGFFNEARAYARMKQRLSSAMKYHLLCKQSEAKRSLSLRSNTSLAEGVFISEASSCSRKGTLH